VQITNVAFGEEISDTNSRTVVKLTFESLTSGLDDDEDEDDEEKEKEPKSDHADEMIATTVLCSLTPGKVCWRKYFFAIFLNYLCRLNKPLSTLCSMAKLSSNSKSLGKSAISIY